MVISLVVSAGCVVVSPSLEFVIVVSVVGDGVVWRGHLWMETASTTEFANPLFVAEAG
jgi:hypothetical protein